MSAPRDLASDLVANRDYLLSSIADLDREHEAGDVDENDYRVLRERYVALAADALRALAPSATAPSAAEAPVVAGPSRWRAFRRFLGRRSSQRLLVSSAVVCVVIVLGLVAAHLAGVRLPGESATGSVTLPSARALSEELTQARLLGDEGNVTGAIGLYDTVLHQFPDQPEALAYRGWLLRLAGLALRSPAAVRRGDSALAHAVRVAPRYATARALYGLALLEDLRAPKSAATQFKAFLADRPSNAFLESLAPQMAPAFQRAGEPLPAAIARFAQTTGAPKSPGTPK